MSPAEKSRLTRLSKLRGLCELYISKPSVENGKEAAKAASDILCLKFLRPGEQDIAIAEKVSELLEQQSSDADLGSF
jgi:hypothetical protein